MTAVESGGFNVGDTNTDGSAGSRRELAIHLRGLALTADTTNTGTATGTDDSNGDPVQAQDQETVDVINPAIAIVKTADDLIVTNGQTVTYSYDVTNPGDDPLTNTGGGQTISALP